MDDTESDRFGIDSSIRKSSWFVLQHTLQTNIMKFKLKANKFALGYLLLFRFEFQKAQLCICSTKQTFVCGFHLGTDNTARYLHRKKYICFGLRVSMFSYIGLMRGYIGKFIFSFLFLDMKNKVMRVVTSH